MNNRFPPTPGIKNAARRAERGIEAGKVRAASAGDLDLIGELCDALTGCMGDLESWATSGPEGMTPDEKRRLRAYERIRDKANRRLLKGA